MFEVITKAVKTASTEARTTKLAAKVSKNGAGLAAFTMQFHHDDGFTKSFSGPGFVNNYAHA